jgi:hypothetical protein
VPVMALIKPAPPAHSNPRLERPDVAGTQLQVLNSMSMSSLDFIVAW